MTISDPIADMLTRVRNGVMARHESVVVPSSKVKLAIAKILKEEGFINDYEVLRDKSHRAIKIRLRYGDKKQPFISGLRRISRPGLRMYAQRDKVPRVYGGLGVAIVSTPKGLMTGSQAWRRGMGGEILCYVW